MVSTPADWYPDPTHTHSWRWWDGAAWTIHVSGAGIGSADRHRASRKVLFVILVVVGILGGLFGLLLLLGEARSDARSGLTTSGADLVVVSVVCPDEQLLEVRLWRRFADGTGGETVWRAEGATDHVDLVVVGAEIPGLDTVTPFTARLDADDLLELTVSTTELRSAYAVSFRPRDLVEGPIVRNSELFADRQAFERSMQDRSPCGDPYDTAGERRLAAIVGGSVLGYFAALIAGAQWLRRRSRSVPLPPKPPVSPPNPHPLPG